MTSKTRWKTNLLRVKACAFACLTMTSVASANVFDDALVWRQGESLDPESKFTQATESVPATWNGKETEQTVLKINQTKSESLSIPLSGILPANCHKLTMYMRCKWDGDFFSGDRAYLFGYANPWGQYRGSNFSFINLADGTASVRWDCGRNQGPQTTPTIKHDTWYDVFMTIEDPSPNATSAHNVYTHAYILKVGDTSFTDSNISGNWVSWRGVGTGNYQSAELRTTDSLTFASEFKGTVARLGFWNRVLTGNERVEIAATPNLGGNLIRSDAFELTAEHSEMQFAFHQNAQAVYDTTHGSSAVTYYATQAQALSIVAADDSPAGEVEAVIDEGTAKAKRIRIHPLGPGGESVSYVAALSSGDHVLTLRRKSGSLKLKSVILGGSWAIGHFAFAVTNNDLNQYKGTLAPYVIGMETPGLMNGGLSAATDPLRDEAQMIKFSLTKGQAALAYRYEISTSQTKDAIGPKFVIYVNGVEAKRMSVAWQYGNADWTFPAGTFREGENTIAIRYDPADYPGGYWMTFRGHRLSVVKDSFPKFGMTLVVR